MAGSSEPIAPLCSLELDLPPSCIEFCPRFPSYFLVGTYYLQKDDSATQTDATNSDAEEGANQAPPTEAQKRNGSIVIYELADENIVHVQTESQPSAILDLHFQSIRDKQDICGTVSSTGTLDVFRFLGPSAAASKLVALKAIRIPGIGEDVLFLSFAWHPSIHDVVAVTTSQGGAHIIRLCPDYDSFQSSSEPIISHSLETWCVAICPSVSATNSGQVSSGSAAFTLFTGGDDSALQYLTCEINDGSGAVSDTLEVNRPFGPVTVRGHEAGVTAILPLPLGGRDQEPALVVTGSYDDHIRVYSITPLHQAGGLRRARLLAETNVGGGVWRLRLIGVDDGDPGVTWRAWLLASCMHAGSRIVELRGSGDEGCEVEILGRFEEHKSMNYGSDVQPGGESSGKLVCVSTSFYDKLLCLWQFQLDKDRHA